MDPIIVRHAGAVAHSIYRVGIAKQSRAIALSMIDAEQTPGVVISVSGRCAIWKCFSHSPADTVIAVGNRAHDSVRNLGKSAGGVVAIRSRLSFGIG